MASAVPHGGAGPRGGAPPPDRGADAAGHPPIPLYIVIEQTIRSAPHLFIFALIILYFAYHRFQRYLEDRRDRIPTNAAAAKNAPKPDLSMAERMALARERQQRLAAAASDQDKVHRREEEHKRIEKEKELQAIRRGEYEEKQRQSGQQLGRGENDQPRSEEDQTKKAADGTDGQGQQGPRKRLPKLPGGERDHYRPYGNDGDGGGARYRPTGFKRPSKGG